MKYTVWRNKLYAVSSFYRVWNQTLLLNKKSLFIIIIFLIFTVSKSSKFRNNIIEFRQSVIIDGPQNLIVSQIGPRSTVKLEVFHVSIG